MNSGEGKDPFRITGLKTVFKTFFNKQAHFQNAFWPTPFSAIFLRFNNNYKRILDP